MSIILSNDIIVAELQGAICREKKKDDKCAWTQSFIANQSTVELYHIVYPIPIGSKQDLFQSIWKLRVLSLRINLPPN